MADFSATKGKTGSGESVKVVVRVRPLFGKEIGEGREVIVHMDIKNHVAVLKKPGGSDKDCKDFTYDAVFDDSFSQQQIFEDTAQEIVDSVMDGFNGTVFCYGQTGAGKSFTMTGPEDKGPELFGLLPRAFSHIFASIDTTSSNTKYLVRGSFLEIYNEEIRDLLSKNPKERCELKDHPNSGVYVKDLSAMAVKSPEELHRVLQQGLSNRSTGATNMNAESSRSHSIFTITVEQCSLGSDGEGHIRVGKLNMVDLAGSERQSKTGATGDRLKEATKINLSLSALGNVISALVDGKSSHIPYRDSKLTRLLQDSLGGNTKTVMVANVGPADYNFDETLSTLRYAYRAKSIKNKPRINEDPKDAMIRQFQEELMRLRAELEGRADVGEGGEYVDYGDGPVLAPRVEKEVEYVEKVVEKFVEKEVVIQKGPSPEEIEAYEAQVKAKLDEEKRMAEFKRQQIAAQLGQTEEEQRQLTAQVNAEEAELEEKLRRKAEVARRLSDMEHKMVAGKQVMEKAIEQEEILKKRERELRKQKKIEEKLREREQEQQAENLMLQDKCNTQEEQVQKLKAKLQKLWDKYRQAEQEMMDVQQFNQGEREDMLSMIRELNQTLKLKKLIMESFVPLREVQNTQSRAVWDAEEDEWTIAPPEPQSRELIRPSSIFGLPRPTSDFARMSRAMGDPNPRYMYDSVLVTELDLPERTTEDFMVRPELGEAVERAIMNSLSQEDEEEAKKEKDNGRSNSRAGGQAMAPAAAAMSQNAYEGRSSERPTTGQRAKRPGSGRPGTGNRRHNAQGEQAFDPSSAFPQARGLVSRET